MFKLYRLSHWIVNAIGDFYTDIPDFLKPGFLESYPILPSSAMDEQKSRNSSEVSMYSRLPRNLFYNCEQLSNDRKRFFLTFCSIYNADNCKRKNACPNQETQDANNDKARGTYYCITKIGRCV